MSYRAGVGATLLSNSIPKAARTTSANSVRGRSPEAGEPRRLLVGQGVEIVSHRAGEFEVTGVTSEEIGRRAAEAGLTLYELAPVRASLEEAFIELTSAAVEYRSQQRDNETSETEA